MWYFYWKLKKIIWLITVFGFSRNLVTVLGALISIPNELTQVFKIHVKGSNYLLLAQIASDYTKKKEDLTVSEFIMTLLKLAAVRLHLIKIIRILWWLLSLIASPLIIILKKTGLSESNRNLLFFLPNRSFQLEVLSEKLAVFFVIRNISGQQEILLNDSLIKIKFLRGRYDQCY